MPSMTFILTGRDQLSRVLDAAGDASSRLARRLEDAARRSTTSVGNFTTDANGRLHDLQGRFVATSSSADLMAGSFGELRKAALLLAPAAIPAAASLAPIAAGAATVAVATAAMTAAIVPQIAALSEAAEAEKKYEDAVAKSGARSEEAIQAHTAYVQTVSKLPPETRKAAASLGVLKDSYKAWSDSLAGDTMAPVTKGLQLANTLLPKTTGLVKATSAEADRFVTIIGGQMASPGLDALNSKFTTFAQRTLRSMNDELVHLLRTSEGGEIGGNAREFMDWARAQGPTVASVLTSVTTALLHVLQAGSDVGVGLLQTVDTVAGLVSAVPPEAIATFLQLALALKVTKAAALGLAAGRTALVAFAAQILAARAASTAAGGGLSGLAAAFGALSRATKVALIGSGIGILVLALSQLSEMGKKTPADVDKLTTSLRGLTDTGKITGEASRVFGKDLSGLADSLQKVTNPKGLDGFQQSLVSFFGTDSTPVKDAKDNINALDTSLANLVKNGQAGLASDALGIITKRMQAQGFSAEEVRAQLDDYKAALADQAFEQKLAAEAMGLFGQQAQDVQAKLDAQKQSADGLRQSIVALNDAQRQGLGGMIGFEASIDAAAKAARDNAGALSMTHGQLDLNSEKARNAASALQDLASKTDEAAGAARESGSSWEAVNGIYSRGRTKLIESAQAMGLSKREASALANQILKIPDKTAKVSMNKEDAQRDLEAFNVAVRKSPGAKSVTLSTLSKTAEQVLEQFGYKVKRLPNGSVTVSAKDKALGVIRSVATAIANLRSKEITITTNKVTRFSTVGSKSAVAPAHRDYATGGPIGFPGGGPIRGPGTGTSDSIPIMASNGEYMINAKSTAKYRSLIEAINEDRLGSGYGMPGAGAAVAAGLASGMSASAGTVNGAARAMAAAVTAGIREELEIASPSKKTTALAKDIGRGLIVGLTGSQAKIKSVSADLVKDIQTAFSGRKESGLVRYVDKQTGRLLAAAKKRDAIVSKIAEAKKYASDLTSSTREGASLSNLGLEPEQVSAGSIKAGLAGKLAQIKQFTRYIDLLAKKGLARGLLRQILNMGPEAGYAYASALVGADKGTFKQINALQSQVDSSTTALGKSGADKLYDSGRNASKGFLTGLLSQEKSLEATMERLAKSMQKALRKALGIKSPARAMIPDGVNTVRGVALGIEAGLPHVDRAMDTVAGRMAGRAAAAPVAGRAAVVRGGGGTIVQVTVQVAPTADSVSVGKAIQKTLLELKRNSGGGQLGLA
jgi:DNA-binding transcriptional MerR regulator/chorismate mutase